MGKETHRSETVKSLVSTVSLVAALRGCMELPELITALDIHARPGESVTVTCTYYPQSAA